MKTSLQQDPGIARDPADPEIFKKKKLIQEIV